MAILNINKESSRGYLFALISVIIWGFSFIWEGFLINNNIEIYTFIFERMLISSLILWIVGFFAKSIQKVNNKDFKWFFLLAFGEPFIYFIGENFGIKYTGSGVVAALIIATIPIFCLFSERIIDKTPISKSKLLGCFITLPGILMVVFEKEGFSGAHIKGILLLFLSVIGAVVYTFFAREMIKKYNAYTIVTWQFTFGAILFLPLFLLFGRDGFTKEYFSVGVQSTIFALAILCSCLCFALWAYATGKLGVTSVSIFSALIPAISALVAYFLYPNQERFTWIKLLGIFIVIFGVVLVQISGRILKAKKNPKS